MTRVSDNSNSASINYTINKSKAKLEDLQTKGASLKKITRPSDDPLGNIEAMAINSNAADNTQYLRNSDFALVHLNTTEKALEQLSELLNRAKEIAISQSSDFYGADIRKNVANEVQQLRNQALAIANQRLGNRYIFSGYNTLKSPFTIDGKYNGDMGHINVEISKDFFIPINLNGVEIFFSTDSVSSKTESPLKEFPELEKQSTPLLNKGRDLASVEDKKSKENVAEEGWTKKDNIFAQLANLSTALENNDADFVRNTLERLDDSLSRLITLRTKVGSITNNVSYTQTKLENEAGFQAERKSKLLDADVAELYSDIVKQQHVLKTAYQSSKTLMNQSLLDFIR